METLNTYEGIMIIKWYKNDSGGDRRGLTLDLPDRKALNKELRVIRHNFLTKQDPVSSEERLAYSVTFEEIRKRP